MALSIATGRRLLGKTVWHNGQVDAIVKCWARISRETNCSIVLVHHSRKLAGQQVDAEAARGASALGNAARSVLVLNGMQKPDATRIGIREEDRRDYFRVSNDKSNRAPAGKDDWFRRVPVRLGNGGAEGGDSVVAIEQWAPPEMSVVFDAAARAAIQAKIMSAEWRAHFPASDWAGKAVANVIGADVENPTDRHRVKTLLRNMLADGELRIERRADANRKIREFIVAGEPVNNSCDSPMW